MCDTVGEEFVGRSQENVACAHKGADRIQESG